MRMAYICGLNGGLLARVRGHGQCRAVQHLCRSRAHGLDDRITLVAMPQTPGPRRAGRRAGTMRLQYRSIQPCLCARLHGARCPPGGPGLVTTRSGLGEDAATDAGGRMRRHHAMEPWAKTLTAIVGALRAQGLSRVDELRRHIEDLAPQDYDRPYFERWAEAFCDLLEEKGFTSRAEIEARMAAMKAELEQRPCT